MDPKATYLEIFNAMMEKRYADAYYSAENLKNWLGRGGFYPQFYTPVEVDNYLNNVLRRTEVYAKP